MAHQVTRQTDRRLSHLACAHCELRDRHLSVARWCHRQHLHACLPQLLHQNCPAGNNWLHRNLQRHPVPGPALFRAFSGFRLPLWVLVLLVRHAVRQSAPE